MKTENVIKRSVDRALKSVEFLRKSNTWYRDLEETVLLVEVQKSNFGEQHYINVGVFVKGIPATYMGKLPPRENECHIRIRIEGLAPDAEESYRHMLNLEDESVGVTERQQLVERAIADVVLPFLFQCSTRTGIRDAHIRGHLDRALVNKSLRESVFPGNS